MSSTGNPFDRSDLNMEIRRLLAAPGGITEAEALKSYLPCLAEHPGVVALTPQSGGRRFERGLTRALSAAIDRCDEQQTTKQAVRWHIALDRNGTPDPAQQRITRATEIVELSENRYCKDRQDAPTPLLTIALESIETALDELGTIKQDRRQLEVGAVSIEDIIVIASCRQQQDATSELTIEWEADPREKRSDCEVWPLLSSHLRPELAQEAKESGRELKPGDALDLVFAEALDPEPDGTRRYRLGVAKTDYGKWATTANVLDRDLSRHRDLVQALGYPTLRQAWNSDPASLENLGALPAPCMLGVCVVVIADGQIVFLPRQRKHHVAGLERTATESGRQPVHFVGEGMTPDDWEQAPSPPDHAALRGCWEELQLEKNDIELVQTAVVLDTKRWQPLFCYLALCNLTIPELKVKMLQAQDDYETGYGQIAAHLPWTINDETTRSLLTGTHPTMRLASNHAEAALLFALTYTDGLEHIATATEAP